MGITFSRVCSQNGRQHYLLNYVRNTVLNVPKTFPQEHKFSLPDFWSGLKTLPAFI